MVLLLHQHLLVLAVITVPGMNIEKETGTVTATVVTTGTHRHDTSKKRYTFRHLLPFADIPSLQ